MAWSSGDSLNSANLNRINSGGFFNVLDKAYSSTSTAASFQAAIDAASAVSGTVVVPSNASGYIIDASLQPKNNVLIRGEGMPKIQKSGAISVIDSSGAGGVKNFAVENLTIDGNNQGAVAFLFDTIVDEHIRVENCRFENNGNNAVRFRGVEYGIIKNNFISQCSKGITLINSGHCLVDGNELDNIGPGTGGSQIGILVWGTETDSGTTKSCRHIRVFNNSCYSISDNGIRINAERWSSGSDGDCDYITITGNSVESTGVDAYRVQGRHMTLSGNVAVDARNGGYRCNGFQDLVISNNIARAESVNATQAGIELALTNENSAGSRAVINNNIVSGTWDRGIYVTGDTTDGTEGYEVTINGNIVSRVSGQNTAPYAISLFRWTNAIVTHNSIHSCVGGIDLSATTNAYVGGNIITSSIQTALRTGSTSANIVLGHNTLSGNSTNVPELNDTTEPFTLLQATPLSLKTQADFNDLTSGDVRLVLAASGVSLGISSGDSLYIIGSSALSEAQPTS